MPRVTRVPGHTTLTPSPLMRRKPQHVTLAADIAGGESNASGVVTPPRATSPATAGGLSVLNSALLGSSNANAIGNNTLSPNTRLTRMVHEGTVAIGGAGGGPLATITTLKSDLVMLQSELDALAGGAGRGGALELQSTLARFGGSQDERVNVETCNTLLSLVLLKINELCRLHRSSPATAPRQSRVGDILSFFRGLRTGTGDFSNTAADATAGGASPQALIEGAKQHTSSIAALRASPLQHHRASLSSQPPLVSMQRTGSRATNGSDNLVEDIAWDVQSASQQQPHRRVASGHLDVDSHPPSPAASRNGAAPPSVTIMYESRKPSAAAAASVAGADSSVTRHPGRGSGAQSSPGLAPASPRGSTTPPHSTAAVSPTTMSAADGSLKAHVARLEKQLQLFKYLERSLHVVDAFDGTLKHCTMNETLKEIGVDMMQLLSAAKINVPPHTTNKAGVMRAVTIAPRVPVTATASPAGLGGDPAASGNAAPAASVHGSPMSEASGLNGTAATATTAADDVLATPEGMPMMPETQAVATLKSLVAFQNAVVSVLASELKKQRAAAAAAGLVVADSPSPPPFSSAADLRTLSPMSAVGSRASLLDHANSLNLASPRELADRIKRLEDALAQRNEQLAAERQLHFIRHERAANVILAERARSSTPSMGTAASRPGTTTALLNSMEWSRPATTLASSRPQQQAAPLALPPVPLSTSPIPILATRPEDVPGASELIYRRTIAQQGEIIKDLQRRVNTPDVPTRAAKQQQQQL